MDRSQNASLLDAPISSSGESSRSKAAPSSCDHLQPLAKSTLSVEQAWSQQNLLSLDGGGIRGYWTLLVLQQLMKDIAREENRQRGGNDEHHSFSPSQFPEYVTQGEHDEEERGRKQRAPGARVSTWEYVHDSRKFLPCHYFDYICGSSTGALIAIMLGRFRMPVWDCLREYEDMSHSIFGKPRLVSQRNIGIVRWPKYSASALEKTFQKVTARRCERTPQKQNTVTFQSPSDMCKTFVTALAYERKNNAPVSEQRLYLLRTYKHEKEGGLVLRGMRRTNTGPASGDDRNYMYGLADNWQIERVARAATAAPMYFKELPVTRHMRNGETMIYFSDGGFGQTNNPTFEGINEIKSLHGGKDDVGVVVNVGTSRGKLEAGGKSIFKRVHNSFDRATDPEIVAKKVNDEDLPHYWRFNDDNGIGVDLDEWKPNGYFTKHPGIKTLDKIRIKFNAWAVDNGEFLRNCAEELVSRRRARTKDRAKWEAYAINASYACNHGNCRSKTFVDNATFEEHLRQDHFVPDSELPGVLKSGTKMWQYQEP